ncbi:cadherin EGF LAG seven-pass G-type receptor 2 [Ditylenchus destructor]|nr:cadherin EGF LAG seven-pass G-type receptor 2 [Ditylenchus destructor]
MYASSAGHCIPCECGYGSLSSVCTPDQSGQCPCSGDAVGRRCDLCAQKRDLMAKGISLVLDRKSLTCAPVRDKCPASMESGIQWSTTSRGATARQSCPASQLGIATRKCSVNNEWFLVNTYNCTMPQLHELQGRILERENLNPMEVSRQLVNVSSQFHYLHGRNFDTIIDIISTMVDEESGRNATNAEHAQDIRFTRNLLTAMDRLMTESQRTVILDEQLLSLLILMEEFGRVLAQFHQNVEFLRPFRFIGKQFVFAIDRLNTQKFNHGTFTLPKYDNFPPIAGIIPFQIHFHTTRDLPKNSVFYMSIPRPLCRECLNPIVAFRQIIGSGSKAKNKQSFSTIEPIQLILPIDDEEGWKSPECVWLGADENLSFEESRGKKVIWRTEDASLVAFNRTHVVCEYRMSGGVFTVLNRGSDQISLVHFSLASFSSFSYVTPLCALFALILCIFSLYSALFRHGIRTRFIRCTLICVFMVNAACLLLVQKVQLDPVFCPARNAILSFTMTALFAWLFLYSLHVYRILAEGQVKSCFTLAFVLGVFVPSLCSIGVFLTSANCLLTPTTKAIWLLVGPSLVFLLLTFYAVITSAMISLHKQYDLVLSKFAIRRSLANHSILTLLCTVHNCLVLISLAGDMEKSATLQVASCIVLVLLSIYVFLWTNFLSSQSDSDGKSAQTMWAADNANVQGALLPSEQDRLHCDESHSPYMSYKKHSEGKIYEGVPNEWIPDIMQETYVHHTLQRSLQLPQILSPLPTQLITDYVPADAQQYHALPPEMCDIPPQYSTSRMCNDQSTMRVPSYSNTLTRNATLSRHTDVTPADSATLGRNNASPMKFAATADEMNDAYYTYNARRAKTPATTFN